LPPELCRRLSTPEGVPLKSEWMSLGKSAKYAAFENINFINQGYFLDKI
jgi:hypothetical protein